MTSTLTHRRHTTEPEDLPAHLTSNRATFLGRRSTGHASAPLAPTPRPPRPPDLLEPGNLLEDKYEVRSLLGSGGMGQVYEAFDRGLNRSVAIKVAWPHLGAEALHREAQVLAVFRHPGLVTAYELGHHGELEFLVMERILGATMAEYLRKAGALPVDEVVNLLVSICDTLAVVHGAGLAHCDLKPANIMLAPGGRVVLLDFGIVRIEQNIADRRWVSGSPHYMAPETIRGKVRAGEARLADIYAMGVIAYVLATGSPPYDHPDQVELMIQHLDEPVPRASALRPNLPARLVTLIFEMMAKDPADRPARIEVVRDELAVLRRRRRSDGRSA